MPRAYSLEGRARGIGAWADGLGKRSGGCVMSKGKKQALWWAAAGVGALLAGRALLRRARYLDLRGKTVLVTGGSRGLGLILARQLAAEGAQVAICARDPDELERARADLAQRGAVVHAAPC